MPFVLPPPSVPVRPDQNAVPASAALPEASAEIQVPFYLGRGIIAAIERRFTCDRFEPFASDPGHVGTITGLLYTEAVWPKVRSASWSEALGQSDLYCVVHIPTTQILLDAVATFLAAQVGKRYSLRAILLDLLGWVSPGYAMRHPDKFRLSANEWTCSALVYAALKYYAGISLPEVDEPVDPNRLLGWLTVLGYRVEIVEHCKCSK